MNTKHISIPLAAVVAAMGLWSCSDHESSNDGPVTDMNAIRFAANTELNTRAGDITTNNLVEFNVYAYTGVATNPTLFMDNVNVIKTGTNAWTYSPVKYWPAKETVDFYAYAPTSWVGANSPLKPVPYNANEGFEDIVYAVSPNLSGNAGEPNAQVVFNFRHALSKVSIKMSSSNSDLQVKVSNVVLANVMSQGNFNFPQASTAGTANEDNVGTWTDQNTPLVYIYHMAQSASDVLTLTPTPTEVSAESIGLGGARYLIPQALTYRSHGAGKDNYIAVMCSVYDTKTGDKLWPNANTPSENVVEGSTFGDGLLKFPLLTSKFSEWHPGCYYIYNLVINSNEEMGAIEFGTPTVDTFIDVLTNYE
ncbi:MAG: fimbrillin family protein [Bacteroides sp.]|nr:fimbrillin family protein [Bacteroides sp.]